jgi:hypothetical protein
LRGYVYDGKYSLTAIDKHVTYFYYYNMRAYDKPTGKETKWDEFDSGLLEEEPENKGAYGYRRRSEDRRGCPWIIGDRRGFGHFLR